MIVRDVTPERLAEIEARANAAGRECPGEWRVCEYPEDAGISCVESEGGVVVMEATNDKGEPSVAVAEFIAAARQDVPDLCAALRESQAEARAWEERCRAAVDTGQALGGQVATLKAEVERLRGALEFYAPQQAKIPGTVAYAALAPPKGERT